MNLSKKLLVSIGVFFLIASCSIRQKPEQEVMSEIYSGMIFSEYCPDQDIVINSLTDNHLFDESDWQWVSKNFPKLKRETWENFVRVNLQSIPFPGDLSLGCKYTLQEVEQNPPDSSLMIYSFSQIGFDTSQGQALVFRYSSFAHSGSESMYFAEMVDGHWRVTNMLLMSIID